MSKWTAASDVDYRNEVCGLSLAEEKIRLEREEEVLREQRWAEFVGRIRKMLRLEDEAPLERVLARCLASFHIDRLGKPGGYMADFAAEEGWPNVLRAIARAIEEEEQYRKELVDRR